MKRAAPEEHFEEPPLFAPAFQNPNRGVNVERVWTDAELTKPPTLEEIKKAPAPCCLEPIFACKCPKPALNGPWKFDGATIDPEHDNARLSKQLDRVRSLMLDGAWRTLYEISAELGYPEQSVSARLRDLRKKKHMAFNVERRRRTQGTYEYRVSP